jgi:hypothetical protein
VSHRPGPDLEPERPVAPPPELGARGRVVATVMWCSFLAASVATMISFALVDPAPIAAALPWAGEGASRTTVYSLGFFYFWAICAAAGALTAFMLSPPAASRPASHRGSAAAPGRSLP